MATKGTNLSSYNKDFVPNGAGFKIGIVVSTWNEKITSNLFLGAHQTLLDNGVNELDITIEYVPGAFELPLACQLMFSFHLLRKMMGKQVVKWGNTFQLLNT